MLVDSTLSQLQMHVFRRSIFFSFRRKVFLGLLKIVQNAIFQVKHEKLYRVKVLLEFPISYEKLDSLARLFESPCFGPARWLSNDTTKHKLNRRIQAERPCFMNAFRAHSLENSSLLLD